MEKKAGRNVGKTGNFQNWLEIHLQDQVGEALLTAVNAHAVNTIADVEFDLHDLLKEAGSKAMD